MKVGDPRALMVTTMNAHGYDRYGAGMLRSMARNLDPAITLRIYAEGFTPDRALMLHHWQVKDLDTAVPWLAEFKAWCDEDPARRGMRGRTYDMRMDARRFSHKVAAFTEAALGVGRLGWDLIIWADADTLAHAPVDLPWLQSLIPADCYMAWLDRGMLYPECGFFMVRPQHPAHDFLWAELRSLYTTRSLIQHHEWHDSYLIQQVMERAQREGLINIGSLSGPQGRRTSHPLVNGPLGARLDHLKGPRKDEGRSRAGDLRVPRAEPYWSKR